MVFIWGLFETPPRLFSTMSVIAAHHKSLFPTGKELAILHAISDFEGELGHPPNLGDLAEKYGITRQAIHYWVKRLRVKNLVEPGPGAGHTLGSATPPIKLTQSGRYFIATSR